MDGLTGMSERIGSLYRLSNKSPILLDDVQKEFTADLQSFIVGETLTMQNGQIVIGNNLYNKWLEKIGTKGFDYEIDFKNEYC
jgi:hypothetical protein